MPERVCYFLMYKYTYSDDMLSWGVILSRRHIREAIGNADIVRLIWTSFIIDYNAAPGQMNRIANNFIFKGDNRVKL